MKIIKRSGTEVTFDIAKIMAAVSKANKEVVHSERLSDEQIEKISVNVEEICQEMNRSLSKSALPVFAAELAVFRHLTGNNIEYWYGCPNRFPEQSELH